MSSVRIRPQFPTEGCHSERRLAATQWPVETKWKLTRRWNRGGGFFLATLPTAIKSALSSLRDEEFSDARLEVLLKQCIHDADMRIETDFAGLFPGPGEMDDFSRKNISEDIRERLREGLRQAMRDPDSRVEFLRARTGTTAVVALIDPKKSIHVASSGTATQVNALITHGGVFADFSLGDTLFKLSAIYTEGLAARNKTPPYLSNIVEVVHLALPQPDTPVSESQLILASDGLFNIMSMSKTKGVRQLSDAAPL
ncbi:hypothetical protein C8R44DRAFT_872222 [Mycena epipterygia]|nr:hypothetical protein C8R44DRAFT_872222 [Mycena epipterygia]